MKQLKNYLALIAFLIVCAQLEASATLITVTHSKKAQANETRNVSGFHGISSAGSYNVIITMGNTEGLKLEGDSEQISQIETIVEGGILNIRNKKRNGSWKQGWTSKVNIYVNAKTLSSITLSGSGDISTKGVLRSSDVTTNLSGSGNINLSVESTNYAATISGSGEIEVKGRTENAKINVNGSGDFDGDDLRAAVASARVSGSGEISINADKSLEAIMSGSGKIEYGGNPSLKSTKSGSGKITKR